VLQFDTKTTEIDKKTARSQEKITIFTAIFLLTRCKKPCKIKGKSVKIVIEMQLSKKAG